MGCEGADVVKQIRRVEFRILPEDDWKDETGQKVIGPVYELNVTDLETMKSVAIRGDTRHFDDIIIGIQAVLSGHDSADEWTIYGRDQKST